MEGANSRGVLGHLLAHIEERALPKIWNSPLRAATEKTKDIRCASDDHGPADGESG
jgi:hypothetical protein